MLNEKQEAELYFWRNLIKSEGKDGFVRRRRADFYRHMNNFNGWADVDEVGGLLEIGSGLYTMLNFTVKDTWSIDPLGDIYQQIEEEFGLDGKTTQKADGEDLIWKNPVWDKIINWNVIDHTPNPQKMADEMYRVLKTGGKLYFEVNFDDELARPHYSLWNEEKVSEVLNKFKLLYKNIIRNETDKQTLFYGVYEKV